MWNYICVCSFGLLLTFLYHCAVSRPTSVVDHPREHYDYIVVGAGTAGCVLASRLSELPNSTVLLVEAGGYFNWLATVPLAAPLIQRTSVDWAFKTETQYYSSRALQNHQQLWPRGKGLGGSGQLNYLVHSFGIPEDYDDWPPGWSYSDLHTYFKKIEPIMGIPGLIPEGILAEKFIQVDRSTLTGNVTIERAENTIKRGGRWSTYHAYLQNSWNRKNLHILPDTLVSKILFNNSSVEAITIRFSNGTLARVHVNVELIICAGAVGTPHLLMASGVGPREHLEQHQIPVVRDVPQVGKNLFDHLNLPMYVKLRSPVSITLKKLQSLPEVMKYFIFENGLLAMNGVLGTARRNHCGLVLFGVGTADEKLLKDVSNYETEAFRALFPSHNDDSAEGFLFLVTCLQPKTRGNITLMSQSIVEPPRIEPAYLENSVDISCTQDAIKLALEILNSMEFQDLGVELHVPNVDECRHFPQDYADLGFSECIIRFGGLTGHHPGGSCSMGTSNEAVVDPQLRVKGLEKLRLADASVMPGPVSGTPNSVVIAIAERAADLVRST